MNDFWLGTFAGAFAAIILFIVAAAVVNERINELQAQMNMLQKQQAAEKAWIEENKTVMQTYKFFNESWAAIIKLQEERNDAQCE